MQDSNPSSWLLRIRMAHNSEKVLGIVLFRAILKGVTENEMFVWHHQINGHEIEIVKGGSEGQGRLACCSPWSRRVGHDLTTELTDWLITSSNLTFLNNSDNLSVIMSVFYTYHFISHVNKLLFQAFQSLPFVFLFPMLLRSLPYN